MDCHTLDHFSLEVIFLDWRFKVALPHTVYECFKTHEFYRQAKPHHNHFAFTIRILILSLFTVKQRTFRVIKNEFFWPIFVDLQTQKLDVATWPLFVDWLRNFIRVVSIIQDYIYAHTIYIYIYIYTHQLRSIDR
jgi:hypothetical protein